MGRRGWDGGKHRCPGIPPIPPYHIQRPKKTFCRPLSQVLLLDPCRAPFTSQRKEPIVCQAVVINLAICALHYLATTLWGMQGSPGENIFPPSFLRSHKAPSKLKIYNRNTFYIRQTINGLFFLVDEIT